MTIQDDAPLLITEHELIALIALAGTTGALKCQSLFRLDHAAGAPLEQAGVATLLERGLMKVEEESLLPVGPAAGVAAVLADSDAWLEVALVTPKAEHVYFLFGSGNGALLLSLSKYGVHELRPLTDADGMFTTAVEMVSFYLGTAPDGRPAAGTLRRHVADGTFHSVHIKAGADGSLEIVNGDDAHPAPVALRPEDLEDRLRQGLGLQTA
ncbi:hypothetical protein [Arthrobacter sp. OY3WO11]|uniref:hypothetical protein n=1 Tax=Arthrobacter sp. OY3WO11 TaxID=1835723 RepID=UPI0007CF0111|nr:hypothetical protein [Arthrobacter sp. OY3WO11]OAE02476.1 hypothetical protein A6A22_14365 [Arthrobacter sp. OY3WO11]